MKSAALTTVVMLTLSASAFAQEYRQEGRQETQNERDYRDHYSEFTVGLRDTIPGGKAFNGARWGDLYSAGVGLELQYSHLERASSWIYGGWYAGLDVDSFGGRTSTQIDPVLGAIQLRTNRLNVATAEFGGKLRQNFNGFHVDENLGVGAAIYMKGKASIRGLGINDLEFIKSSVNYMVDIGVRLGAPIGKDVELGLGIAYQMLGAPDEGKDFKGKFKSMGNVVLALSLDFGF